MTENRREEDRKLSFAQKALVLLGVVSWTAYMAWRAAYTMNWDSPTYSVIFYLAELIGYTQFLRFAIITWKLRKRTSVPCRSNPTVDVLIPTYNEDPEILFQTIFHCIHMDYPHETYVLDDGNRPEIAKLAKEFGAHYIARTKNEHGKGGNLNHALAHCKGEVIAVIDADGIPRKDFLTRLLGYLDDPEVALVQVPQSFYNLDSFQHVSESSKTQIWHEQALFFDVVEPGLDYHDLSMCCGSGSILRRSALDKIGGFTTGSVTEDLYTTLRLHMEGMKSVYHAEPLAFCLAPATVTEFVVQRARWALGTVQILRMEWWKILTAKKLSAVQKLLYMTPIYYFGGFQRAVYYLAPFLYLVLGISPFNAPAWFSVPYVLNIVITIATFRALARGRGRVFTNEVFYLYTTFPYIKSVLKGLFPINWSFRVTSKKAGADRFPLGLLLPAVGLIAISALGVVSAMIELPKADLNVGTVIAGMFGWMNLAIGYVAINTSLMKKPVSTEGYSFFDYRPLQLIQMDGVDLPGQAVGLATAISEKSVDFVHTHHFPVGAKVKIGLSLPESDLVLETEVVHSETIVRAGQQPFFESRLKFVHLAKKDRVQLVRYFFEDATPRVFNIMDRAERASEQKARKGGQNMRKHERMSAIVPVYVEELTGGAPLLALLVDLSQKGARVKLPKALDVGSRVQVHVPWFSGTVMAKVVRCLRESGQVNPPCEVGFEFETEIQISKHQQASIKSLETNASGFVKAA